MKGYLSIQETAGSWGISVRWVNQYILEERVPGCERFGRSRKRGEAGEAEAWRTKEGKSRKPLLKAYFFDPWLAKTNIGGGNNECVSVVQMKTL
ncbi:MAG: hypothetical protein IJ189_12470 [Clostridia bacterium]|nr:hypothetical protein [Clostridia bacterium]